MADNPIVKMDFPDPDVIRVGDTYYLASTTMHFMPGAVILRSYDLAAWEIAGHVYERLEDTPARRLEGGKTIYGQGMWAPCLRRHEGTFFVCFSANDTRTTCLYSAERIEGPWRKRIVRGFYHDCSLLFDDDGRIYIAHGNKDIRLTELEADLSGPKAGGLDRLVVRDRREIMLGYEGSHFYKIDGRYVLLLIHWPRGKRRRQACFVSDSLEGEFRGGDVLDDDLGYRNQGVAQGGLVDTPDGRWYAMLFQDRGAAGRLPVLVPVEWRNGFPVFGTNGEAPARVATASPRPGYVPRKLYAGDDFRYLPGGSGKIRLNEAWEWNHLPDDDLWSVDGERGVLRIAAGKLSPNLTLARNTLTQRTVYPACAARVEINGSGLHDGDYAGLCALQGRWGLIAVTRESGGFFLVMKGRPGKADMTIGTTYDEDPGREYARVRLDGPRAVVKAEIRYGGGKDTADFFHKKAGDWEKLGTTQQLYFGLDHFTGCRFGLFVYATRATGGSAEFGDFVYEAGD